MSGNSEPLNPPGRVAVVGTGGFGRFCIGAYQRAGDLATVAAADPDPRALEAITVPDIRLATDWRQVITDPTVEVIHVATPPHLRADIISAAFGQGKSIFCEKPIALSLQEADDLIYGAREAGVALGIDYVMRHLPAYSILQRLAESRVLGALRTISFENFAQAVPAGHWFWNPEQSGGILVEHGVHFFDAYGRIAGEASAAWSEIPRPDAIDATVRYRNGALGRYFHEFAYPRQVERTTGVSGFERGLAVIDGWIPTRLHVTAIAELRELETAAATPPDESGTTPGGAAWLEWRFPDRQTSYARAIASGMRETVRQHRDPNIVMTVDAKDARDSLALALQAREHSPAGRLAETESQSGE